MKNTTAIIHRILLFLVLVLSSAGAAVVAQDFEPPDREEAAKLLAAAREAGDLDAMAEHAEIANVELLRVESDDPGLPAAAIDTVLMVDVMHYVKDRSAYAAKLRPALAPGGRVVIIDFRYDPEAEREFAPRPDQQVPRATLDKEMIAAGFKVAGSFDFLPEQYFVIYRVAE